MQIINLFHHGSIHCLNSHLDSLHYLVVQRTNSPNSPNLFSLLPLLFLQFFSITFAAGQNIDTISTRAFSTADHHSTAPITSNTATTVNPNTLNAKSTSSLPSNSATNTFKDNFQSNNPTTLSTNDLNEQKNQRRYRISNHRSPLPETDTLLNSLPIFPLSYDNLQPPKQKDGGKYNIFNIF